MTTEPTNAQLLASTSCLILLLRQIIERADRDDRDQVDAALDAIHGHLAVCGGSMIVLGEYLGVQADVEVMIQQKMQMHANLQASGGLVGRA